MIDSLGSTERPPDDASGSIGWKRSKVGPEAMLVERRMIMWLSGATTAILREGEMSAARRLFADRRNNRYVDS